MEVASRQLSELLAKDDGQRHRILFVEELNGYLIPVEIMLEPRLGAVAVVAATARRLPFFLLNSAATIARLTCFLEMPEVIVDEQTRMLMTVCPALADDLKAGDGGLPALTGLAVQRLLAVAYRIDLCAQGLSTSTVMSMSEHELLRWNNPLRRFRPFKKSKRTVVPP